MKNSFAVGALSGGHLATHYILYGGIALVSVLDQSGKKWQIKAAKQNVQRNGMLITRSGIHFLRMQPQLSGENMSG